ncbi:hypothetical protein GGS20DRAFT_529050 [Poronia punctata]|nr:hypothetical protein GGS20DRAFT_529050 [Poronia punctata]
MLSNIVAAAGLLVAASFAPLVEAGTTIRASSRPDTYAWTIEWTAGPCRSWPCSFSYHVTAPSFSSPQGPIPLFDATCKGPVDKALTQCQLLTTPKADQPALVVSGNFSTYETSGVGAGLIDITATFFDFESGTYRTLTVVTPKNSTSNKWDVKPDGCPLTYCVLPDNSTTTMTERAPRRNL